MTGEILFVLLLLAAVVGLFAWGKLRPDVVALLVLAVVGVTGLVEPAQALAGFSNPAVVAVAGMFVISAGLARTGVASFLGREVLHVAGGGEVRLVVALMLLSGALSGFMNNVGVAAMMMPVVVEIARKSQLPPSKLLIPMALGAQLGGFTTLIGTSPNLLAGDALAEAGEPELGLFEFTPMGVVLLGLGTLFVAVAGPRLLPTRDPSTGSTSDWQAFKEEAPLEERIFRIRVPEGSLLEGKTLEESLVGSALGLQVLAVERSSGPILAPGSETVLKGGDRLVVQGPPDLVLELGRGRHLVAESEHDPAEWLTSAEVGLVEVRVAEGSPLAGETLNQADFRRKTGTVVLALRRNDRLRRTHLQDLPLQEGDSLLVQGPRPQLQALAEMEGLEGHQDVHPRSALRAYGLAQRLTALRITEHSLLEGRSLAETHLGDAMGLTVLAVTRQGITQVLPDADFALEAEDILLVKARPEDLASLRGLQRLEVDTEAHVELEELESEEVGLAEVVLAPRSGLVGRSLRALNFRGRFGATVLAVWRQDRAIRSGLRDEVLRFGDALLLYGPWERLRTLRQEPDFIVLSGAMPEAPRTRLAPLALLVVAGALVPVVAGWLSIALAAVAASVLLVMTRCLTVEEAYRAVDWPTVILVAGMLALGAALNETGAAAFLGERAVAAAEALGPRGILLTLCLLTALGAQVIPGPALVVLMAPIALGASVEMGLSPRTLVLGVVFTATTLASPVAHPAHALVMAPAGYRMGDFLRLGGPLTLLVLLSVVVLLPFFFPF